MLSMTKQKQRLAEGARRSPAYGDLSLLLFILNIDSLLYYILVMYTIVTKKTPTFHNVSIPKQI